jgi:hypothetical protein
VHPHNAKECGEGTLEELRRLAGHARCVAVGECGLDFNRNFSPPGVQEEWFDRQVGGGGGAGRRWAGRVPLLGVAGAAAGGPAGLGTG